MVRVRLVHGTADRNVAAARRLFREYADGIGVDLCFEGFDEELEHLEEMYGAPRGDLWVAWSGARAVGCVGLRRYSRTDAEMKRLYVRASARGLGVGRRLVESLLERAPHLGYRAVRLDTLPSMREAQALYRSLGFRPIPPYQENPVPDAVYLRWSVDRPARSITARAGAAGAAPPPRFVGLHHVQLSMPAGQESEARRFYGDLLGLPELPKPPRLAARGGLWFRCGEDELHLGIETAFRPASRAHPAWEVSGLATLRRRLARGGVDVRTDRALPGVRRFYATDLFGNRLEFLERTARSSPAPPRRRARTG